MGVVRRTFYELLDAIAGGGQSSIKKWVRVGGANVGLDADGRVVAGGPARWKGVHVSNLAELERQARGIAGECPKPRASFRSRAEAVAAILDMNPDFAEWLQTSEGRDRDTAGGLFDAFNEAWEPRKRITTYDEALAATVAIKSRRWSELKPRLAVWSDSAWGKALAEPAPAVLEEEALATDHYGACLARIAPRLGELRARALVDSLAADDDVPF